MHSLIKYLLLPTAIFIAAPLSALAGQTLGSPAAELMHPRSAALGGAVVALPDPIMSVRANPAGIAAVRGAYSAISYAGRKEDTSDNLALTLIDNSTSKLAGALQYGRTNYTTESEEIGLTIASGDMGYLAGVTTRYLHYKKATDNSWDGSFVSDVGMQIFRESGLGIGLVGRDLFAKTKGIVDPRASLGLSYSGAKDLIFLGGFTRYFDEQFKNGSEYSLGLEWSPYQTGFSIRAGQSWDNRLDQDFQSLGLGWSNKKVDFGYAWRTSRQHPQDNFHLFSMSSEF